MSLSSGGAAAVAAAGSIVDDALAQVRRLGLSPRQKLLDHLWAFYKCSQYDSRSVAWDGTREVGFTERDSIALQGYVPPGFEVAGTETLPIRFRRPTSPYHLCRVIVERFTGLLFGSKRHPKIQVTGDPISEDFVAAVAEEGRLWAVMTQARSFGGATGTAVVGFQFVDGRPCFEALDPRWCTPVFLDRSRHVLQALEYRYIYPLEVRDEKGAWVEVDTWYRRVVTDRVDVVYRPAPVGKGEEPTWEEDAVVQHDLGFCPIVWTQNLPEATLVDGESDCHGIYELVEGIDRLLAQAERGVLSNCDPTPVIISQNTPINELRKGSNHALHLVDGSFSYAEMTGGGITQARESIDMYRRLALEVAQCVLEQPDGQKTATEVERNYAAMLAKADVLREQYGELIRRLVNMVLVAARLLTEPRVTPDGIVRGQISLPPRVETDEAGKPRVVERRLGSGPYRTTLVWPPYFEPGLADASQAVTAAAAAKTSGLVDDLHATRMVAPYFQVEDVAGVVAAVRDAQAQAQAQIEQMSLGGVGPPGDDFGGGGGFP